MQQYQNNSKPICVVATGLRTAALGWHILIVSLPFCRNINIYEQQPILNRCQLGVQLPFATFIYIYFVPGKYCMINWMGPYSKQKPHQSPRDYEILESQYRDLKFVLHFQKMKCWHNCPLNKLAKHSNRSKQHRCSFIAYRVALVAYLTINAHGVNNRKMLSPILLEYNAHVYPWKFHMGNDWWNYELGIVKKGIFLYRYNVDIKFQVVHQFSWTCFREYSIQWRIYCLSVRTKRFVILADERKECGIRYAIPVSLIKAQFSCCNFNGNS